VDILFLAFVVVSFLLTKGDHLLITYLTRREKIGFIHIYEALKEEVLLVGIISLLLTGTAAPPLVSSPPQRHRFSWRSVLSSYDCGLRPTASLFTSVQCCAQRDLPKK
jgi:hypothetical protein